VIEDLRASDAEMTVKGSGKNDLIAEEFKNRLERSKHYESVEVLSETDNSAQPDKIG